MNVETCLDYKKNLKNLDCSIIYDFVHFKAKQHCLLIIIGQFSIEIYSERAFFFILLPSIDMFLKTLSCLANVFTEKYFYRLIIFRSSVCSQFHQKIWLIFLHSSTFNHTRKSESWKLSKLYVLRIWLFPKSLQKSQIRRAPVKARVEKQSARISNNTYNLLIVNQNKKFAFM